METMKLTIGVVHQRLKYTENTKQTNKKEFFLFKNNQLNWIHLL